MAVWTLISLIVLDVLIVEIFCSKTKCPFVLGDVFHVIWYVSEINKLSLKNDNFSCFYEERN